MIFINNILQFAFSRRCDIKHQVNILGLNSCNYSCNCCYYSSNRTSYRDIAGENLFLILFFKTARNNTIIFKSAILLAKY